jgi:hypothetical protein
LHSVGQKILQETNFVNHKTARQVAEDCGRLEIYNLVINDPVNFKFKGDSCHKTLVVTDERMLRHAPFSNYSHCGKRVFEKNDQPENAERLMVLTDSKRGVLAASKLFRDNPSYQLVTEV